MRYKLILCIIIIMLVCTGCTVEANRIYTKCKIVGDTYYCYNTDNEYYYYNGEMLVPVSGVGLRSLPALHVIPTAGDYVFTKQIPGLYTGTLTSVNHYVHYLITKLDATVEITYQDWNTVDLKVISDTVSTRIIFNIKGDVRIYAIDNSGKSINPLYINSKRNSTE